MVWPVPRVISPDYFWAASLVLEVPQEFSLIPAASFSYIFMGNLHAILLHRGFINFPISLLDLTGEAINCAFV